MNSGPTWDAGPAHYLDGTHTHLVGPMLLLSASIIFKEIIDVGFSII